MSTGHAPVSSSPIYLPHMSPENHPGGPRGSLGPNSPMLSENLAQSVAKKAVLSKISWANCLQSAPAGNSPFLVSWVLATVSSDNSQEDAKATALPKQRDLAAYLRTPFPKRQRQRATWQRVSLSNALFRKDIQPWENRAFGSKYRMWRQLYVMCHFQHAKSEEFCCTATVWMSRYSLY